MRTNNSRKHIRRILEVHMDKPLLVKTAIIIYTLIIVKKFNSIKKSINKLIE